jgi:hypothetical protein
MVCALVLLKGAVAANPAVANADARMNSRRLSLFTFVPPLKY